MEENQQTLEATPKKKILRFVQIVVASYKWQGRDGTALYGLEKDGTVWRQDYTAGGWERMPMNALKPKNRTKPERILPEYEEDNPADDDTPF